MNKIDLNGRSAVVTGGAQGFGRAITERFIASGAKVAIWDHDQPFAEKTAKEIGAGVTAFKVNVSDLAAVEKATDATIKALGKIDILVNNAGIAGINKTVWETDLDEWRKVLRINLDGPFICCKAIVPSMVKPEVRPDHQHRLDRRQGRQPQRGALFGVEGRPDRFDKVARQGTRRSRHRRQRGDPGRGQDRDLRPDDAAAHRLHAVEDSEGSFRSGTGTRGDGGVAGLGGLRVLDRRGVRYLRRPRDVLEPACRGISERFPNEADAC